MNAEIEPTTFSAMAVAGTATLQVRPEFLRLGERQEISYQGAGTPNFERRRNNAWFVCETVPAAV